MNLSALTLPKIAGPQTSRGLSLIAPIGGIVVSLIVLAFIVWPRYADIKELRSANAELASRATSLEAKVDVLTTLDADVLEKQLAASQALLPSDKDVFILIRQIENAAASTGVVLSKVEVVPGSINEIDPTGAAPPAGAPVPDSSASQVQVRLSITSGYASLLSFLSKMYSGARVINVDDITIATASSGESQVRTAFSVDAYWQPLPIDLGSIEKPVSPLTDSEVQLLDTVGEQGVSSVPTVPEVPLGRSDLFAPL